MNLIIIDPGEIRGSANVTLSGTRAAHLIGVLKVAPGSEVRVGVLDGPFGVGAVTSVGDGTVDLRCAFESGVPSRPRVDVLLALPRPKVMRRLWAQIAALGIGRIILTNAERVERNYFDTHVLTPQCYRPLLVEGLQQARDTRLPRVSIHRQFKVLIEDELDGLFPSGRRLVAEPSATSAVGALVGSSAGSSARSSVNSSAGTRAGHDTRYSEPESADDRILLGVGPEGGWNAFEVGLLEAHGFQPAGLGARTLRSDTACIALLAIVHHLMHSRPS